MDHYKALGLSRNAGKEDIKAAFRKLAMQFHPDKHSHSPKAVREAATRRFKQVSEAYEVLMDDRKRADYNLRYNTTTNNNNNGRRASGFNSSGSNSAGYGYGYGYGYNPHSKPNSSYSYYRRAANGDGLASKLGIAFHSIARHSILINLTCAAVLLGGAIIIHSRDTLWKMHNAGEEGNRQREDFAWLFSMIGLGK